MYNKKNWIKKWIKMDKKTRLTKDESRGAKIRQEDQVGRRHLQHQQVQPFPEVPLPHRLLLLPQHRRSAKSQVHWRSALSPQVTPLAVRFSFGHYNDSFQGHYLDTKYCSWALVNADTNSPHPEQYQASRKEMDLD